MANYYKKELPSASFLPSGDRINCDFIGLDSLGYIGTSVGYVVRQLDEAVKEGVGGWLPSTEAEYNAALEAKKKAPPSSPAPRMFRPDQRGLSAPLPGVAVAGRNGIEVPPQPKPDPIRVPTPEQMRPRVGPIPKEAFI